MYRCFNRLWIFVVRSEKFRDREEEEKEREPDAFKPFNDDENIWFESNPWQIQSISLNAWSREQHEAHQNEQF